MIVLPEPLARRVAGRRPRRRAIGPLDDLVELAPVEPDTAAPGTVESARMRATTPPTLISSDSFSK